MPALQNRSAYVFAAEARSQQKTTLVGASASGKHMHAPNAAALFWPGQLAPKSEFRIEEMYPPAQELDENIPTPASEYLRQAIDSLHAPAGAIMLAASAVDAMLKNKGYKEGSLYERIEGIRQQHLITDEMALWAHEVRLDANDQRHADEHAPLPEADDAKRCVEFVQALAEFV